MGRPLALGPSKGIGNPHGYPDWTWPMIWVLQEGELWPIEQWVARQGEHKNWRLTDYELAGGTFGGTIYTVPAGKKLYITSVNMSSEVDVSGAVYNFTGPSYILDYEQRAMTTLYTRVVPPFTLAAGNQLRYSGRNEDTNAGSIYHVIRGYELEV